MVLTKEKSIADDPEGIYDSKMPYLGDLEVMDPVTGWLVCIEGPSKGRDYKIMTEKNFLGRSETMDIPNFGRQSYCKKKSCCICI